MWSSALSVFALALVAVGLNFDDAKNRPVSKVVKLLESMKLQLATEQEEDEKVYKEYACWCAKNNKETSASIAEAEQTINRLTGMIEELTGKSARLGTEISNLQKEFAESTNALEKATGIRKNELADFNEQEKDLLQSIQSLKGAVTVLSKHNKSFVQQESLLHITTLLESQLEESASRLKTLLTPSQRQAVKALLQDGYAPQSGEIFGILNNMLENFENNLKELRGEEGTGVSTFQKLSESKNEELKATADSIDKKQEEKATADQDLAQAKEDRENTRNSLSADEQFLLDVKEKCRMTDEEWEERTKTRQEEMQAISKAISILHNDDARDQFNKALGFLQVTSNGRVQASTVLREAGDRLSKPQLAAIASKVIHGEAFEKVFAAIDQMVVELNAEMKDEIKHKDFCVASLNENERDTETEERNKADSEARINNLNAKIEGLTNDINTLADEIANLQEELKRGGEDREKANAEFQVVVKDQRETQRLLTMAQNVLKDVYEKKKPGVATFIEQPKGFKKYDKKAGGSIVAMLEQIRKDSMELEEQAIHDEENAQTAYEQFVQGSNVSIDAKKKTKLEKEETRADTEKELSDEQHTQKNLVTEIEQLNNHNADLHKSCDFVIKNFDARQKARAEEIEALKQAKAILKGSDYGSFLQLRK